MKPIVAAAPAYWASYLINGDASGLEPEEKKAADAWIERQGMGCPYSIEGEDFFAWRHDAMPEIGGKGATVCEYAFLVPNDAF